MQLLIPPTPHPTPKKASLHTFKDTTITSNGNSENKANSKGEKKRCEEGEMLIIGHEETGCEKKRGADC